MLRTLGNTGLLQVGGYVRSSTGEIQRGRWDTKTCPMIPRPWLFSKTSYWCKLILQNSIKVPYQILQIQLKFHIKQLHDPEFMRLYLTYSHGHSKSLKYSLLASEVRDLSAGCDMLLLHGEGAGTHERVWDQSLARATWERALRNQAGHCKCKHWDLGKQGVQERAPRWDPACGSQAFFWPLSPSSHAITSDLQNHKIITARCFKPLML